jgi:NAD(P)-dependent dehydrogenase (short-subunit alcohol dehydrogenase family)
MRLSISAMGSPRNLAKLSRKSGQFGHRLQYGMSIEWNKMLRASGGLHDISKIGCKAAMAWRSVVMVIAGKVFLVTGAGSGLGAAVARSLASSGANVIIADVNAVGGETVASALGAKGHFIRTDVTSETDGLAAVEAAITTFGHLHGLVNCAGIAPGEKVLGRDGPHSLANFEKAISINLVGTFNMIRLAASVISHEEPDAEGERGVIVNTASIAAFDGQIGQAAYAASKGGIVGMTLPIARELARHAIRVVSIAPGIFETPMMAGMPQEVQDMLGKSVPFPPRLGRPGEFAALVHHIIENSMLNGETIRLDGALRMGIR